MVTSMVHKFAEINASPIVQMARDEPQLGVDEDAPTDEEERDV